MELESRGCLEVGNEFYEIAELNCPGQNGVYYFISHEDYQELSDIVDFSEIPTLDTRPEFQNEPYRNMDSDMQAAVAAWALDPW